jgi:transcriptional regulator with XRE-family HTH domain
MVESRPKVQAILAPSPQHPLPGIYTRRPEFEPNIIAVAIRSMRTALNLSQSSFALLIGVTAIAVHRWEVGERLPRQQQLYHLRAELRGRPSWRARIHRHPEIEQLLFEIGLLPDSFRGSA